MVDTSHDTIPRSPTPSPCPFPSAVRGIGVFSPAGVPDAARLERGCRRLENWGLTVFRAKSITSRARFLAGTDAARLADFHGFLRNPHVDVLMAARGGFGCARLLDDLDWDLLAAQAKPLIGYSDVTALHLACFRAGVRTGLSGPMVAVELALEPETPATTADIEFSFRSFAEAWAPRSVVTLPPGTCLHVLRPGVARGPVLPATLSVLASLLGTPFMPDLSGTVLVLEDVNEPAFHLDRYLTQVRQAGILRRLAGLIFGRFTKMEDAEWFPEILAEFATCVNGPVVAGFPYGHELPLVTVPVGREVVLEASPTDVHRLAW